MIVTAAARMIETICLSLPCRFQYDPGALTRSMLMRPFAQIEHPEAMVASAPSRC